MRKNRTPAATTVASQYLTAAIVEYVRCPLSHRLILRRAATGHVAQQPSGLTVFSN